MSEYKGRLSTADQERIVTYLTSGGSVRGAARDLGISYKSVRTFAATVEQPEPLGRALRVLIYDIETTPIEAYVWHLFGDYVSIDQIKQDSFILSWAAKWYHSNEVMSDRLSDQEVLAKEDARLVEGLAGLLREADVIVAHNGDKFDLPVVNKRLFLHQLPPLGPVTTIDTLKLAKRDFRMASNKLDWIARSLGLDPKIKTDFDLWKQCMEGDVKALTKLLVYNEHDVVLLEQVLDKMLPYVRRVARLFDGPGLICPFCGSANLSNLNQYGKELIHRTQMSTYQGWQCGDCGKFCRSKVLKEKRLPVAPL